MTTLVFPANTIRDRAVQTTALGTFSALSKSLEKERYYLVFKDRVLLRADLLL